jgi:Mg/Co/Ni transporter MgtE
MSPRAAWRLERFGVEVYDYTAGKADWTAAGLPTERAHATPRAVDALRVDVPTCDPDAQAAHVVSILRAAQADMCVVVNEARIVLGRVRLPAAHEGAPSTAVEEFMEPGPTTIRADADLGETRQGLRRQQVPSVIVTTPDGELLGVLDA